jgi:DNA-binding NarL/FixJ family response regulator
MTEKQPIGSLQTSRAHDLRVLIVDDHALLRDGLKQLVAQHFGTARIGEAGDGAMAISMAQREEWDIVLLDISLPGQSGVDVLKQIKALRPAAKVLILTMHPESQYAVRALKAGASGYLTKETAGQEMVGAINKVLAGGKYVSSSLAEKLASNLGTPEHKAPHELLSDREYQVMRMLAMGKTVKEISFDLGLSVKAISTYRTRIMEKFNFKSTADVVRYALEERLI